MQFLTRLPVVLLALLTVGIVWLTTGCEDNNSDTQSTPSTAAEFRLNPSGHSMGVGETQVVLTVVGGLTPFTWSLSAPAMGTLSGNTGTSRTVNYTATAGQTGVNTIQVQDSRGWIASAVIVQEQ